MNKTLLNGTLLIAAISLSQSALAQEWFVAPAGASGCIDCHYSSNGGGGVRPGPLSAYYKNGLQGLYDYLHPVVKPDTAPVLSAINNQWDVTVGEAGLLIPLSVTDNEKDSVDWKVSISPLSTATLSALYTNSKALPTKDVKWTPTATQANKDYTLTTYVKENGVGRSLTSKTLTANIHVWAARTSATKNVSQFALQNAQWSANKLTLSGLVTFKANVTATQRTTYLNSLTMALKSKSGIVMTGSPVKLAPTATGSWTKTFTLTGSQVPCTIHAIYEGLNAQRPVISAPTATCVK